MEKALGTPSHVMIYKQYWDYYFKAPALLEKLKLEQPIMVAQDTSRREGAVPPPPAMPPWTQTGLALSRLARVLLLSIILATV